MIPVIFSKGDFTVSTDQELLDLEMIHGFLQTAYWCKNIPFGILEKSIKNSLCFGLYHQGHQIGFARVITDYTTMAHVADVFILPDYRGRGLATWLMDCITRCECLQRLRRWSLGTEDAHDLYRKFGFTSLKNPKMHMERTDPLLYRR